MRTLLIPVLGVTLLWGPSSSPAQVIVTTGGTTQRAPGIRLEGAAVDLGIADPQSGDWGPAYGASVSLGTLFSPWLDFGAGVRYWSADITRDTAVGSVSGTLRDFSVHSNLSLQTFRLLGWRPYLKTGLAGHFAGAKIEADPVLEDALAGFHVGFDAGVGLATGGQGLGVRIEALRSYVEDVGHWNFTVGVGSWPSQRASRNTTNVQTMFANPAPSTTELLAAIEQIGADNRLMRAEIDSLRRAIDTRPVAMPDPAPPEEVPAEPLNAEPEPVAASPAPEPVREEAPAEPRPDIRVALRRLVDLSQGAMSLSEESEGVRVRFSSSVLFASGSSTPQPAAVEQFRRLSIVLFRFPDARMVVEGHTDAMGSADVNLRLSQERAEAVRSELIRVGIEPYRIQAVGHGSTRPIADNATDAGRSQNRRVEVFILVGAADAALR